MKLHLTTALLFAAVSMLVVSTAQSAENLCYIEAAENPIYVRVYNANDYGEKTDEIWSGWLEPYRRVPVQSRHGNIIYDYKTAPESLFHGSFRRICDEDNTIQVIP